MNRLFLPIRVILGQLRTMPALAAGVVLLVLLFATISWSYIDSIRARIDVVERELIGLEYSQRVRSLVMSIQERRGHLSMLSAGESGHEGAETRRIAIDALFGELHRLDDAKGDPLGLRREIHAIETDWESLAARESTDPIQIYETHTRLIGRLVTLHWNAIHASGLDLDPYAETYHLIQILDLLIDLVLEPAGQLRGLHASLLASPSPDPANYDRILGRAAALGMAHGRITHHVQAALAANPDLQSDLGGFPLTLDAFVVQVRRLVDRERQSAGGGMQVAQAFFEAATLTIREGYRLYDAVFEAGRMSLSARLERERTRLSWAIFITAMLALGILYLIGGILVSRHERASTLRELAASEVQLRLADRVFENAGEAIMVTDSDNRIISVNPAFVAITGFTREEVIGQTPAILKSGRHDEAFYRRLWDELLANGIWQGEIWDRRSNGEIYPKWLTISVIRDPDGRIANHVAVFTDISERKANEERVHYLAEHDALTGLPNRALFHDRLTHAIAQARRCDRRLSVLFIDLDRFKVINDSLGHHVGDALLQEVARRLNNTVRATDTVCRQGGDEFLVLLDGPEDIDDIARIAQKISEALSQPYRFDGNEIMTTPSIGIGIHPDDGDDPDTLIRNADTAMYHAKERGRNTWQFFTSEMDEKAVQRFTLERDLRHALERNEWLLHYQAQIEAATGRIVGIETLVRWRHPEKGLVPPDLFIPIAEETGLIVPLGEWVLREACRQNRAWQVQGLPTVPVAVNLSAVQFARSDIGATIPSILHETGLEARFLELEITEGVVMQGAETILSLLDRLYQTGVILSIDDFGTGYSSLSYLKRFPIHKLKIDQSFVRDLTVDDNDAMIVRAIIALGHNLGLRVIAEGVETAEQLAFLRGEGCEEAQGYLFSRPVPADEMADQLRKGCLTG